MTSPKTGLSIETTEKLVEIFKRRPAIAKVVLYGSRAKGNFKPGSDIDLSIVSDTLSTADLLKIESEIEELLLPYKIDLSILGHIENPDLIAHIQRVGVEFYCKD